MYFTLARKDVSSELKVKGASSLMKQKGSFTPEIKTDIKKRIAIPKKRVTCVFKWRHPLKAA